MLCTSLHSMKATHLYKLFLVESASHDIPYIVLGKDGTIIRQGNWTGNTIIDERHVIGKQVGQK